MLFDRDAERGQIILAVAPLPNETVIEKAVSEFVGGYRPAGS
jgi:hypothetical protein